MSARLTYQSKENKLEKTLEKPFTTIGRGGSNDIPFENPEISRSHALVRCIGGDRYYLLDIGSKNGTYLNGKRMLVPSLLKTGDKIKVGPNVLTFQQEKESDTPYDPGSTTPDHVSLKINEITVLVADICGYTAMSAQVPLDSLAKVLANWFRSANDVIEKNNGFVDKFIGDAVMACWIISDQEPKESLKQTLKAAYDLHRMTEKINLANPHLPQKLRIRVGINTGEAIVGDLGSSHFKGYTVLGDSVNIAFRLEKASQELGSDVAIGYDSFKHLERSVYEEREHALKLKGKNEPIRVCAMSFSDIPEVLL